MILKILKISERAIAWALIIGIIVYLFLNARPKEPEPKKELFILNIEQFPDGSFLAQYSIEGKMEQAGFYDWARYLEYKMYLETLYEVNEYSGLYQHGIDDLDPETGRLR